MVQAFIVAVPTDGAIVSIVNVGIASVSCCPKQSVTVIEQLL